MATLKFSKNNQRSNPDPLLDATVNNRIFPFLGPGNISVAKIKQVSFYLDGTLIRKEGNAPYDIAGGTLKRANPFDTTNLKEGRHTLRALIELKNGPDINTSASFIVNNILDSNLKFNSGIATDVDQVHLGLKGNLSKSITVVWRTPSTSVPSRVKYRKKGTNVWQKASGTKRSSGTSGTLHQVTVSSLQASTKYEYRVRGKNSKWSEIYTTETAPSPGKKKLSAVFVADTGLVGRKNPRTPTPGTQQIINEIAALDPHFIMGGGDYAYFKKDKRFGTLNKTIDKWFNQWEKVFSTSPILATYGNHEWSKNLDENLRDWAARFVIPKTKKGVFSDPMHRKGNYSYDAGNAHFLSLLMPAEYKKFTSQQLKWIEKDIRAARRRGRKWIIPYFHSGPIGDGTRHLKNVKIRNQIGPLFERLNVDLVLFAHDQAFERTFPLKKLTKKSQTPTSKSLSKYTKSDGPIYAKVSPGGKLQFSEFSTKKIPNYMAARNNKLFTYSQLSIKKNLLRLETFGVTGNGAKPKRVDKFDIVRSSSRSPVKAASFDDIVGTTVDTFELNPEAIENIDNFGKEDILSIDSQKFNSAYGSDLSASDPIEDIFTLGVGATSSVHRLILNTRELFLDPDGVGGDPQVMIGRFSEEPALGTSNFQL